MSQATIKKSQGHHRTRSLETVLACPLVASQISSRSTIYTQMLNVWYIYLHLHLITSKSYPNVGKYTLHWASGIMIEILNGWTEHLLDRSPPCSTPFQGRGKAPEVLNDHRFQLFALKESAASKKPLDVYSICLMTRSVTYNCGFRSRNNWQLKELWLLVKVFGTQR